MIYSQIGNIYFLLILYIIYYDALGLHTFIIMKLSHFIYILYNRNQQLGCKWLRKLSYLPIYILKLLYNIYFKTTLQLFIFASYHVLFRILGK